MYKLVGIVDVTEKNHCPIIKCGRESYPFRLEEVNLENNVLCRNVDTLIGVKVDFNLVNGLSSLEPINITPINKKQH